MSNVEFAPFSDRGIIEVPLVHDVAESGVKFIGGVWWIAHCTICTQRSGQVDIECAEIRVRCSLPLGLATQVSAKIKFMGLQGWDNVNQLEVVVDRNGCTFTSGSRPWMWSSAQSRTHVPLVVAIEVSGKADDSVEPHGELQADVLLDVEGREFPANMKQLSELSATLSDTFKQEFDQNQPKKISLSGISAATFEMFLKALTTSDMRTITVDNVATIRGLADRFHAPSLLKRCAEFVFRSKNLSLSEKLLMADTWNDRNLVKLLSGAVATNISLLPLIEDGTMKKLTQATQDVLLEKLFRLD